MTRRIYRVPEPRTELPTSILLGAGFALALFVLISLAQRIGGTGPTERMVEETAVAFETPEIEEIRETPPPPEEEPPPELEEEMPELSLDQLDIALNPGTGGSLAGDFGLPSVAIQAKDLAKEAFVDFSALDQTPRPIGVSGLHFPRRLLRKKASGKIVVLLKLSPEGKVLDAQIDSSNLAEFDDFVLGEVRKWRFTPPTQQGRPVQAQARLPIPIRIN
jgi:protein TonB